MKRGNWYVIIASHSLNQGETIMNWLSEIRYSNPRSKTYLGSPSIVRYKDGTLVASLDCFGSGAQFNGKALLTEIYSSQDGGMNWEHACFIIGAFWSTIFMQNEMLYLLGTSSEHGDIVIRRSDDGGYTWTIPLNEATGLLFRGGSGNIPPNYHCAPTPVLLHNSRIYKAFENDTTDGTCRRYESFVISCDINDELLYAPSWSKSNAILYDRKTDPPDFGWCNGRDYAEWCEGNVVVDATGRLKNIIRVYGGTYTDYAGVMNLSDDGLRLEFEKLISLPGGAHKFTIRRDQHTGKYITISNNNTFKGSGHQRNELWLNVSSDLENWTPVKMLISDDSGLPLNESLDLIGFQYVDWQFDGDDLIFVARVSYDGAKNFHDSNRIVFSKVEQFRNII